eukprot:Amastigsp_a509292_201.p3 type:complete len:107 gc:universal Amastigsp_a509292_201:197-517(+)
MSQRNRASRDGLRCLCRRLDGEPLRHRNPENRPLCRRLVALVGHGLCDDASACGACPRAVLLLQAQPERAEHRRSVPNCPAHGSRGRQWRWRRRGRGQRRRRRSYD